MISDDKSMVSAEIVAKAKSLGASLAGIATIASLECSPSHEKYKNMPWPQGEKSVLVLALNHEASEPELDWWDGNSGTQGNRRLIDTAERLVEWLNGEFTVDAHRLPYHVERGGIFVKDAAVLAGLGAIGLNNLLVTPEFGPRVRLSALLIEVQLPQSGPMHFTPCESCDMPCRRVCPQKAFENGSYSRFLCNKQMEIDRVTAVIPKEETQNDPPLQCIRYCRACELACPVGS